MDGRQYQCFGMADPGVTPAELAAVAEELAKTSSKVCSSDGSFRIQLTAVRCRRFVGFPYEKAHSPFLRGFFFIVSAYLNAQLDYWSISTTLPPRLWLRRQRTFLVRHQCMSCSYGGGVAESRHDL